MKLELMLALLLVCGSLGYFCALVCDAIVCDARAILVAFQMHEIEMIKQVL